MRSYPVSVCLGARGDLRLQLISDHGWSRFDRRILRDEGCRSLVTRMLKTEIGKRPIPLTLKEAGKLYGLAWLLADLEPSSPEWNRVIARFPTRCNRAGELWASTRYLREGRDTAALFRALVFKERSPDQSLGRIAIDRQDFDVIEKALGAQRRNGRRWRVPCHPGQIQWGGILCKKLSTVMLVPVDRSLRPIWKFFPVITHIGDLPLPARGTTSMKRFADAVQSLAERIGAADPSISAHMLIAMQAPLLNAADEFRHRTRSRRD
jgi:hypothetical protein